MKKILLLILILLSFGMQGCDRRTILEEVDPIIGEHHLFDNSISSALRIVGNPRLQESTDTFFTMQYSITTLTRIRLGTSRQVDYYQFDWIYEDDTREIYYNLVENELRQDRRWWFGWYHVWKGDWEREVKRLIKFQLKLPKFYGIV